MKFKKIKGDDYKFLNTRNPELVIETRADGKPGLYISAHYVFITRAKALKLAWAIINELDPSYSEFA
jgi:hypothetical protein